MSDASKVMQWSAEYQPWGAVQSLSGPLSLDLRFPGLLLVNIRQADVEHGSNWKPACITTGTAITIQASAVTRKQIRSASLMGRVSMGMLAGVRIGMSIQMDVWRRYAQRNLEPVRH